MLQLKERQEKKLENNFQLVTQSHWDGGSTEAQTRRKPFPGGDSRSQRRKGQNLKVERPTYWAPVTSLRHSKSGAAIPTLALQRQQSPKMQVTMIFYLDALSLDVVPCPVAKRTAAHASVLYQCFFAQFNQLDGTDAQSCSVCMYIFAVAASPSEIMRVLTLFCRSQCPCIYPSRKVRTGPSPLP